VRDDPRVLPMGRFWASMPESVLMSVDVFLRTLVEMDTSRCGDCGGPLAEDRMVCAVVNEDRTVLTFKVICEAHSAKHDPTWVPRVDAPLTN
jgi:hypothetical protein